MRKDYKMYYDVYYWENLEQYFDEFINFSNKPKEKELDPNYVFDEDKSVKWNRTEVAKHNQERNNEIEKLINHKNKLWNTFVSKLFSNIKHEFGLKQTYDILLNSIFIGIMESLGLYDDYDEYDITTVFPNIDSQDAEQVVKLMYNITYRLNNSNFGKSESKKDS